MPGGLGITFKNPVIDRKRHKNIVFYILVISIGLVCTLFVLRALGVL